MGFNRDAFLDWCNLESWTVTQTYDTLTTELPVQSLLSALETLKENPLFHFQFLTDLCGVHLSELSQLGVVYHLHNMEDNVRLRIKVYVPQDQPIVPSIVPLFACANWMERETYDFFGIQFEGHPNLIRILNVDDMTLFPMRKDHPLEDDTREDKQDDMFGR